MLSGVRLCVRSLCKGLSVRGMSLSPRQINRWPSNESSEPPTDSPRVLITGAICFPAAEITCDNCSVLVEIVLVASCLLCLFSVPRKRQSY